MRCLKEGIESGAFEPVIDRRYPLDRIVEAYRYVEIGQKIGNVTIMVERDDRRSFVEASRSTTVSPSPHFLGRS